MANYHGAARSNHFKVKDREAFLAWVETVPNVRADERAGEGTFVLLEEYGEGWPSMRYTDDGEDEELYLLQELSEHLEEGAVAVLEESGAEKLRYVTGHAAAVNHLGEELHVDLSDIYEKVREAGWKENVSPAAY
jgi:hypothetical protein